MRLFSSQSHVRFAQRALRTVLVIAAVLSGFAMVAEARLEREVVLYAQPVGAEVVDPFRPPAHIGAPGNRGLEYANSPGTVVSAAADGFVIFAGQVGGRGVITIEHADGLRTTYTGLSEVWVVTHDQVPQRSSIGTADEHLHFGARVNDHYLDPQILLDSSVPTLRPRLVPPPD